jgi:predicted protein tyrosine phosphatase
MNLLFICNQGMHRSRTAAHVYKEWHDTRFASLFNDENLVDEHALQWADIICVMEEEQAKELERRHAVHVFNKRIVNLDIPDRFSAYEPQLVALLKKRFSERVWPLMK